MGGSSSTRALQLLAAAVGAIIGAFGGLSLAVWISIPESAEWYGSQAMAMGALLGIVVARRARPLLLAIGIGLVVGSWFALLLYYLS